MGAMSMFLLLATPASVGASTASQAALATQAALAAGEIVVDSDLRPSTKDAIRIRGTVHIKAHPDAIWAAILDFSSRVEEHRSIQGVRIYGDRVEGSRQIWKAYWDLSVLGMDFGYGTIYDCDRQTRVIEWRLDPARADDLKAGWGRYVLEPAQGRPDHIRLTYDYEVLSHVSAAIGIRRRLAASNAESILTNIRRRAQS